MVATTLDYTLNRYQAEGDSRFSGVVEIAASGLNGSGVLLFDGKTVLTAAHIFENGRSDTQVVFTQPDGTRQSQVVERVTIFPDYEPVTANFDLALVRLSDTASDHAKRHELYRGPEEVGQAFNFVGYGYPGTGEGGVTDNAEPTKLTASNRFDVDAGLLDFLTPGQMGWDPVLGSQLVADFDNGTIFLDSLGRLIDEFDTGIDDQEGMLTAGDSGGPAFINGEVAGIASYIARLSDGQQRLDNNNQLDSSFGELGFWQRVSYYQEWIDEQIRDAIPGAPETPSDVMTTVVEGDTGDSQYAFFMLEFSSVVDQSAPVSVAYQTRDGSAIAGEDYLSASGRVNIYTGEQYAVIPVEIIEDSRSENNEIFWLDVFDPRGGTFPDGQQILSAYRTIIDDDVLIA